MFKSEISFNQEKFAIACYSREAYVEFLRSVYKQINLEILNNQQVIIDEKGAE